MDWFKKAQEDEFSSPRWINVDSGWIDAVAYYEPLGMLEFKLSNGKEYSFKDVPIKVFEDFMSAESKGRSFNKIKKEYQLKNSK